MYSALKLCSYETLILQEHFFPLQMHQTNHIWINTQMNTLKQQRLRKFLISLFHDCAAKTAGRYKNFTSKAHSGI